MLAYLGLGEIRKNALPVVCPLGVNRGNNYGIPLG